MDQLHNGFDKFMGVMQEVNASIESRMQSVLDKEKLIEEKMQALTMERTKLDEERALVEREKSIDRERKLMLDKKEEVLNTKAARLQSILNETS